VIADNPLKQKLKEKGFVTGTFLAEIRQPSVMQLLKNAGFDFVLIDGEHGAFNLETLADLSRTARYVGLTPIVRPSECCYSQITTPLDGGAQGLMVPRITTPEQVKSVLSMMKYPPEGARGNAQARGYTNFRSGNVLETMKRANEENLLVVQVETKEAVECIEDIVQIPGVDIILVGPNDLSISLGVGGQMHAPQLVEAITRVISACNKYGVVPGIHCNDLAHSVEWTKKGMRFVSALSEIGCMVKAGLDTSSALNQAFEQTKTQSK
jgi:2-keto-3-deoxy-L-rhamnonate aldolase RhmA